VDDATLGSVIRLLRQRRGWRQHDLALRAGVSDTLVGVLELGGAERMSVRRVRRVCAAVGIRLGWDAGYRRAELAQMRDERHAALAERVANHLDRLGWLVAAEVSFNEYGDRGRIDLLAYEPASRTLIVIEIKTAIVDLQDLLGGLDVKQRLARNIARRLGWDPLVAVPAIVLLDHTTNRRRVATHERLLARFSLRGRGVRLWLRRPVGSPTGVLLFLNVPNPNRTGVRRVRIPGSRAEGAGPSTKPRFAPSPISRSPA
jgi:transcriptional regulator with XRE-family HTH domain